MQISGKGPAFGKMQMLVGRGENPERESLRGSRGEQETGQGARLTGAHCTYVGGLKSFFCGFCLSAKLYLTFGLVKASGLQPRCGDFSTGQQDETALLGLR